MFNNGDWVLEYDENEHKGASNPGFGPVAGKISDCNLKKGPYVTWADDVMNGSMKKSNLVKVPAPGEEIITADGRKVVVQEYPADGGVVVSVTSDPEPAVASETPASETPAVEESETAGEESETPAVEESETPAVEESETPAVASETPAVAESETPVVEESETPVASQIPAVEESESDGEESHNWRRCFLKSLSKEESCRLAKCDLNLDSQPPGYYRFLTRVCQTYKQDHNCKDVLHSMR